MSHEVFLFNPATGEPRCRYCGAVPPFPPGACPNNVSVQTQQAVVVEQDIVTMLRDLISLKSKGKNRRLLSARSANETSTAVTPAEASTELTVFGVGVLANEVSHTAQGRLKDAKTYFQLLKEHIEFDGAVWDVTVSANRQDVIIRHCGFGSISGVRFPYNAANVKNHWVAFQIHRTVLEYFQWVSEGNIMLRGEENTETPPSS